MWSRRILTGPWLLRTKLKQICHTSVYQYSAVLKNRMKCRQIIAGFVYALFNNYCPANEEDCL